IKEALEQGRLVENQITVDSLKEKIKKVGSGGYVLDGYPRNSEQLSYLDNDIDKVFYINVSDDEAIKRLTERARHDDTPELIKKRIDIYHDETEPLLKYFRDKKVLEEINGEQSIEKVSEDLKKVVSK
ncbi:nucleoside monophosphate kinase, partial [Candidatus Curtissbacteria bacterium]|nr:nucleoside monophosphate kinase [Candidatus Curtissbacteria bacterium]